MDKIGQRAASVKRKRIISVLICMLLVLNVVCLTGCGAGKKWKDGKCTISIECSSILDNMEDLKETKKEFVPSDGWTAFDVLKQICGKKGIHMASRYTPLYKSYYVEGINQLYEFDCGKNSGWMYSVNGEYPNYGASSYNLKDGDKVEWRYTCNLGSDVGDKYEGK